MWDFESDASARTWTPTDVPVSGTLYGVTDTSAGPCAVGAGGVVVGRGAETWGVVVENGPAGTGETLRAVDSTDGGKRVWFAGSNGALGYYDHPEGERQDCSTPNGVENTFRALAVAGRRGAEKLLIADGSGTVLSGEIPETAVEWDRLRAPGGAPTAFAADGAGVGYAVDANGAAWQTTPEDGWERFGVAPASGSLYAVTASSGGTVVAGGDNGRVFERENAGAETTVADGAWTPFTVSNGAVRALDVSDGRALAGGEGGTLAARATGGDWTTVETGVDATLRGVLASAGVAVGGNATVLEAQKKSE